MRGVGAVVAAMVPLGCLAAPPSAVGDPTGDAAPPADATPPACDSFGSWSLDATPVLEGLEAGGPTVTADQLLLLYETPAGELGIAERADADEPFEVGDAALLALINTAASERNPSLSTDGLTLWFTRGVAGDTNIYVTRRNDRTLAFSIGKNVAGFATLAPEGPETWDAANRLLFSFANPAQHDVAFASCADQTHCTPGVAAPIGSDGNDWYPTIRGDGLELVWRNDTIGLLSAIRTSLENSFGDPEPLDFTGGDPELSPDGASLYFTDGVQLLMTTRPCE